MMKRLLLCSDGSEHSLKAARQAAAIARKFDSELTVLHVFQMPVMPAAPTTAMGVDPALFVPLPPEAQDSIAQPTLDVLKDEGVKPIDRREIGFSPAEVILRVAEETGSDLIVLGSRGSGAVERFFLGSVSDRVVHHAHCPVLIVR